jgi:adenylosuccinate lyase
MIPRYSRPKMTAVWTDKHRFETWLSIELLACEAWNKLGLVPDAALKTIKGKAAFEVDRIDEIERTVKHDVIAFLTSVAEHVGPDSRYIHLGLTSSDVLDTSLAVLMKEAGGIILGDIDELLAALKEQALAHKRTLCIGRTHGVHAEPTTFGLKMAGHWDEVRRGRERFARALEEIATGKISGAVGNYFHLDPRVEEHVCRGLGLRPAPVSSQIVQRDVHASYLAALALMACSLERLALEIRARPRDRRDFSRLASELHLSYSHFRRLFRNYLGRPPHDYLLLCRMLSAAEELKDRRWQIKEVAARSGYEDPAQFSRAFKSQIGVSPLCFRAALYHDSSKF